MLNDSIRYLTLAMTCAIAGIALLPNSVVARELQSGMNSHPVNDPAEAERARMQWEDGFARLGMKGRISNCRLMLRISYDDMKDESYGAVCSFDGGNQPRDLLICDDTLIGNLTIKAWGYGETEATVLSFTQVNCPGGG